MIAIACAAALISALIVGAIVWSIGRARARALAEDVQRHIEPYLARKASEAGLDVAHDPWTSRSQPEEIVTHAAGLAEKLLAGERMTPAPAADIRQIALADTQQVTNEIKKNSK